MTYVPPFHGQLTSADPLGPDSCVAYSGSYAIAAATLGAKTPTGRAVRDATGDTSGGLELGQVAAVIKGPAFGILATIGTFSQAVFESRIASGLWGAVLIGGYAPVERSAVSGCPGFTGNHAIWCEAAFDEDPLADGRRAGIYQFAGKPWPAGLRRAFAGALRLSNGKVAGPDHFEAILVPLPAASKPKPKVRVVTGFFRTYTVHNTGKLHAVGTSPRTAPKNTTYTCSPAEWPIQVASSNPIMMRQLTSGPFAGLWAIGHGQLAYSQ